MKLSFLLAAIVFLSAAGNVSAENSYKETMIRCEKGIVSIGDFQAMLIVKCGKPIYQAYEGYHAEQWTYVTDGMVRVVAIRDGVVRHITTTGRAN